MEGEDIVPPCLVTAAGVGAEAGGFACMLARPWVSFSGEV